jgi:hypothetical protein
MGYGNGGTALSGGVGGATAVPVRQSVIVSQTDDLTHQIEILQQHVAGLEKRLEMALQPSAPEANVKQGADKPMHSVPYARTLSELTDRLMGVNRRLDDIIQRIEI